MESYIGKLAGMAGLMVVCTIGYDVIVAMGVL